MLKKSSGIYFTQKQQENRLLFTVVDLLASNDFNSS